MKKLVGLWTWTKCRDLEARFCRYVGKRIILDLICTADLCGLQGLIKIYRRGIEPLGHLHTGNIYLVDESEVSHGDSPERAEASAASGGSAPEVTVAAGQKVCRVGGYENWLLGYKTRLYRDLQKTGALLDIYLFGIPWCLNVDSSMNCYIVQVMCCMRWLKGRL